MLCAMTKKIILATRHLRHNVAYLYATTGTREPHVHMSGYSIDSMRIMPRQSDHTQTHNVQLRLR
jgi:hypothetical protein